MPDIIVPLQVPEELFNQVKDVSKAYQSDFNTDIVHFLEYYVSTYQKLVIDPAAKVLLKG